MDMQRMISADLLEYITNLLLGPVFIEGDSRQRQYFSLIRYTDREEEMKGAVIVIKPSSFFSFKCYGTAEAEPKLPLCEWEGVPLLFGEPRHEWINGGETLLLHADLIASTFYLISRYEEMTHRSLRDELGRFPGRLSLPYRAGFIHRPIIDEYSLALRDFLVRHGVLSNLGLRLNEQEKEFSKIKLTHDVCRPFKWRGLRNSLRAIFVDKANPITVFRHALSAPESDPYYTYDAIFECDAKLLQTYPQGRVHSILFFRVPTHHPLDVPRYLLTKPYMYHVLSKADRLGAIFGLLCSHRAATNPRYIAEEMKCIRRSLAKIYRRLYGWYECKEGKLTHAYRQEHKCQRDLELMRSRHSSLAMGEPEDVRELLVSGIRHDYSMGYADVMGFRLGTSRPVRFINPNTRELTDLIMHPLTIDANLLTDVSISGLQTEEDAYRYCIELVDRVRTLGGELNLSWQTDLFAQEVHPWGGRLYQRVIDYLCQGER